MNTNTPTHRISGPVDLIATIPHLLGFQPTDSLVLIGLSHGALVVTARVDLDDATHDRATEETVAAMRRGGATQFIAAVFANSMEMTDTVLPYTTLVDHLRMHIKRVDGNLLDALLVSDGVWWSYLCADETCCPRTGRLLPDTPSAGQVAATVAGLTALPSRDALAAQYEPDAHRENLLVPLEQAYAALEPALVDSHLGLPARTAITMIHALRSSNANDAEVQLTDYQLVPIGAALRQIPIRDAIWIAVDAADPDASGEPFWLHVARRLPSPWDAAPLFLHAWTGWRRGDGARANIAVERALGSDPDYRAAQLLAAALQHGVDPRRFPLLSAD